jgi:uncharacterized alkaline shock family protein YloU/adenylate kinase family enzyme
MEIYALVGKSGTGKSYKSQYVAGLYNIEYILDDGLLIRGNKVITGMSAKRESTRVAAVRRAIYSNREHKAMVTDALKQLMPKRILILGTSEHMIQSIIKVLELGSEYTLIRIEDVSTPQEIEEAVISRKQKGKHVIPVPTFEVKKDFSGYLLYSIRQLIRGNEEEIKTYEKTVVRPTFSYFGKYDIRPSAIRTIVNISAMEIVNVNKVFGVEVENNNNGVKITASVGFNMKEPLYLIAERMAGRIKDNLEYMTNINVIEVNVVVRAVKIE